MVETLQFNEEGLIPVIVQDAKVEVLMLAYMNETALTKTIETKEAWFWSRSRQELWNKGATSGHFMTVQDMSWDCDRDTLLLVVQPMGPACHNGTTSCFNSSLFGSLPSSNYNQVLLQLEEVIAQRKTNPTADGYTTYLFEQGVDKILKKIGEEASEVIIAAKNKDVEEVNKESVDLLYHLFVLWREMDLSFEQIVKEVQYRTKKTP